MKKAFLKLSHGSQCCATNRYCRHLLPILLTLNIKLTKNEIESHRVHQVFHLLALRQYNTTEKTYYDNTY